MKLLRLPVSSPGLFRFILAIAVYISHCTSLQIGLAAVYVFFALSGYWIQEMAFKKYSKFKNWVLIFYASRLMRLLPVFLLGNALAILLETQVFKVITLSGMVARSGAFHFTFSNLMFIGYSSLGYRPNGPAWSIDIELQFYLLAPLIFLIFRKSSFDLAILFAAGLLALCTAILRPDQEVIPKYLFFFIIGILAARNDCRFPQNLVVIPLYALALITIFVLLSPYRGILLVHGHPPFSVRNPAFEVFMSLFIIPYGLATTKQPSGRRDQMLGDLSYVIYLLHWPSVVWLHKTATAPHRLLHAVLAWAIVLPSSLAVWVAVDRPMNQLRAQWIKRQAQKPHLFADHPSILVPEDG